MVQMAGMNLEAQSLYIPRPVIPCRFTPHSTLRILSPQRRFESSTISDEPPLGIPRRRPLSTGAAYLSANRIL
jgi:hypothetical protein